MKASPRSQRERLNKANWEEIIPRALLWADMYCRHYFARIPIAPQANDLLQQAITDLFLEKRNLPENQPIFPALIMVMKSIGYNFLEHQRRVNEHIDQEISMSGQFMRVDDDAHSCSMDFEVFLSSLKEDKEAIRILELKQKDPELRARDIAALLNISIKDIYNALKRVKRKLEPYAQMYR